MSNNKLKIIPLQAFHGNQHVDVPTNIAFVNVFTAKDKIHTLS